jgi:4-nitrophenyl phosphatase
MYIEKFKKVGIDITKDDLMLATVATARFIAREKPNAKIFTTGEKGFKEELKLAGLKIVEDYRKADYLVVASNTKINFDILTKALIACLRKNIRYVAVNPDKVVPCEKGVVPGTGMIIGALYWLTGREPDIVIGKPSTIIVEEILRKTNMKGKDAVIVGDQPGTDIKVANKLGITSILVLTGAVNQKNWKDVCKKEKVKPDIVLTRLSDIISYLC